MSSITVACLNMIEISMKGVLPKETPSAFVASLTGNCGYVGSRSRLELRDSGVIKTAIRKNLALVGKLKEATIFTRNTVYMCIQLMARRVAASQNKLKRQCLYWSLKLKLHLFRFNSGVREASNTTPPPPFLAYGTRLRVYII